MPCPAPGTQRIESIRFKIVNFIIHGKHERKSGGNRRRHCIRIFRQDLKHLPVIKKHHSTACYFHLQMINAAFQEFVERYIPCSASERTGNNIFCGKFSFFHRCPDTGNGSFKRILDLTLKLQFLFCIELFAEIKAHSKIHFFIVIEIVLFLCVFYSFSVHGDLFGDTVHKHFIFRRKYFDSGKIFPQRRSFIKEIIIHIPDLFPGAVFHKAPGFMTQVGVPGSNDIFFGEITADDLHLPGDL